VNLGDMLYMLRNEILHDRTDQVNGNSSQLWSDATLCFYINEAVRRFAKETLCIRDGTTPGVTQVVTVAEQAEYPLDPSVIAVLSVRGQGNGYWQTGVYLYPPGLAREVPPDKADLARAGHANLDTYHTPDTYFFNPDNLSQLPPGKPLVFATDEYVTNDANGSSGVVNLRFYPRPSADFAGLPFNMRVARYPLTDLTNQNLEVVPEIPRDWHLYVLDWAAYLALRIVDHELGDPAAADKFAASFEKHVIDAKAEFQKKLFQPNVWAFGRNGFSFVGN